MLALRARLLPAHRGEGSGSTCCAIWGSPRRADRRIGVRFSPMRRTFGAARGERYALVDSASAHSAVQKSPGRTVLCERADGVALKINFQTRRRGSRRRLFATAPQEADESRGRFHGPARRARRRCPMRREELGVGPQSPAKALTQIRHGLESKRQHRVRTVAADESRTSTPPSISGNSVGRRSSAHRLLPRVRPHRTLVGPLAGGAWPDRPVLQGRQPWLRRGTRRPTSG